MAKPLSAKAIALYEALVETLPDVELKGKASRYTSRNGHMFSFLCDPELALRLPEEQRDSFRKKYKTDLCIQHGAVMVEYVMVPASLLAKTQQLSKWFKSSYDYIGTLKPKPTTRKKSSKKKSQKKSASKKKSSAKKTVKKATKNKKKSSTTKKKGAKKKTTKR